MPPMAVNDDYGDGVVQTHRTVTRYRVKRPNDSFSSQDSISERDNLVEVDQEPPQRRSHDWERYTRSSDHLPEQRMVVRHRPEGQGALVARRDYSYDDDDLYRRRRWEDDRRRQHEAVYYQGAVVPHDSVSQDSSSSSESERENHKKHQKDERVRHGRRVVEGALVGAVGAEVLRKTQGRKSKNRNRDVAAGAVLGGGVIEALSRARSHHRSSNSPERRGRRRSDEHERRSSSHEKYKKLAEYAAGAVAVGAIANYAMKKRRQSTGRRSKSRSKSRSRSRSRSRGRHSKKEEEEKKKKLAAAGVGTAAIVAAGAAYARSRSRKRSRSRPGSPGSHQQKGQEFLEKAKEHKGALAVAGLGAAGLAAFAQKKHKEAEAKKAGSRSHSRKRSNSRHSDAYDSDGEMVAYGSDPVPVDGEGSRHSGRRSRSRSRSQSRTRSRRGSMSNKIKGTAEGLIAAGAGAFGANELRKKYEERKAEREDDDEDNNGALVENRKHGHNGQDDHHREDYQNDGYYQDEQPLYSPPASGVYSVHDPYAPQANSRTAAYNPTGRDHRENGYGRRDDYDGPQSAEDLV